ncbi:hypothetical protein ACRAKI_12340 [Saccharothrix isguenensis]
MRHLPGPYAAWTSWLEAFGRGEDLPSGHLPAMTTDLGPDMTERLFNQVVQAFQHRQRRWHQTLQRDMRAVTATPAGATTSIAAALRNARGLLSPLRELAELPQFPAELRDSLRDALADTVRSAQRALEDSVRDAPAAFQAAIRANSLIPGLTRPRPAPPAPRPASGRRVIL